LILRARISIGHAQRAAERESKSPDEIPERNMPPEEVRRRFPPLLLRLKHVQRAADDEAASANDLGNPVRRIESPLRREILEYTRQRGDASDAEYSGTSELGRASKEAQLVEVVGAEIVPRGEPLPLLSGSAAARGCRCLRRQR
jgi:hypothetical protein